MPEGKPFTFEAEVTSNPNQARAEGDRLADAFGRAMRESLVDVADALTKTLSKTFKEIFDPTQIRQTAAALDDVTDSTRRIEKANEALLADVKALQDRTEGFRDTLTKAGANPKLFAVVENQIGRILKLERELESDLNRFGTGSKAAARIGAEFQDISNIIRAEVSGIRGTLDSFTTAERRASVAVTDALNRESVERRQIRQQEHGRTIAALQGANAKELKEIAGANQRALVSHRAASKARIELLQFTLRQIRVLERSIGRVFEGTAAVISGSFARIANTTKRITPVFRAQNSAMTQGLQPALLSRERSISRSFGAQEAVIRGSAARQAAALQQLNAQASRGVAGAVSGRSAVGGLLGGGLAFGGVFALITKLKAGFTETVNLNEALNKTTQIFGAATAEIQAFADNSVEALFVTKSEALAAAANFGIFGKAAGLGGAELAKFSKDLTLLATDLASFNNTSIADSTTALAAALRGESEPIRKYGVLLNEAVLQQRAFDLGIIDTIRKLQPFERVLAANAEIFAQTAVQQGDAARTANDFANSSRRAQAASVEFFASIARVAVPLATIITNGLFPAFQNMTKFILNDVGPALQVVRQAAIGAAAGIGALLVAKTAGEALRFLATSLKFVLTPMGALVLAVAAIGAAINVLANRSPELRRIFDDIRESIGERLSQGLELATRVLDRIGDVMTETVIPAAIELGIAVRERLLQGFRLTVAFVKDTVIPAFERFGNFISGTVLPAVAETARNIRDRLAPAFERVVEFIQPAIDAFSRLGDAIRDVFTGVGDFSAILDALESFGVQGAIIAGAAGLAIAAAFVNPLAGIAVAVAGLGVAFGPQLLDVIRPQVERLRDFLADFFSARNLQSIGTSFLGVVRRIGQIIGGIVSDRRFITGLAAVVAAIAATAGAAILGFAEGVRDNIPELIDLLGDVLFVAFREAFKFAFSNPEILVAIIAGATFLRTITSAFSFAGTTGAVSFTRAFVAGIRNVFTQFSFVQGMFGGLAGLERSASQAAQKAAEAFKRTAQRARQDLAALGLFDFNQPRTAGGQFAAFESDADVVSRLQAVQTQFGRAEVAGATFRAHVERVFQSAGVAVGGFRRVLESDVRGGFQQVQLGAQGMARSITGTFRTLGQNLRVAAIGLGASLGNSIALGIGSALSGQLLGEATSGGGRALGVAGILSSAFIAGALAPPGLGIAVGTTVAAVGLVTASLARNADQAKKTEERIKAYADALTLVENNVDAFSTAQKIINDFFNALSQPAKDFLIDAGLSVNKLAGDFARGTLDAEELRQTLIDFGDIEPVGINGIDGFTGGAEGAAEAVGALTRLFDDLGIAAADADLNKRFQTGPVQRSLEGVTSRVDILRGSIDAIAQSGGTGAVLGNALFGETGLSGSASVERRLERAREGLDAVTDALDALNRRRTDQLSAQIEEVTDKLTTARDTAQVARDAISTFFTGALGGETAALDAAVNSAESIASAFAEALSKPETLQESALNDVFRQFDQQVAAIAQAAFEENPAIDTAGLLEKLQPFFRGLEEAAGLDGADLFTDDQVRELRDRVTGLLENEDFNAVVDLASSAQQAADDLQAEMRRLNVALEIPVTFSSAQIRSELIKAGFSADQISALIPLTVIRARGEAVGNSFAIGTADGFERGIRTGIGQIERAVTDMATAAELAAADRLEIRSPSKVFEALGVQIPAGLAAGILAGAPGAALALRELSEDLFNRLVSMPGTLADNFAAVLDEVPSGIDAITEAIQGMAQATFDAIAAMEDLADADLSRIIVGEVEGANPLSNAGRVADRFRDDLSSRLTGPNRPPPGWIQTEDGTWVPPSFFAPTPLPPTPATPTLGVDMPEGSVASIANIAAQAAVAAVRATESTSGVTIERLEITEAASARASAREAVMAMQAASLGA